MAEIKNIFDSWEDHSHTEVENVLKRTIATLQGDNYSQIAVNIPGALNRTFVKSAERVTFFYKVDNTVDGTYVPDFKVEITIGDNVITLTDVKATSADDKIESPNLIPYLTQDNRDVIFVKIRAYTNYGFPSTVKTIRYERKEQAEQFDIHFNTGAIREGSRELIGLRLQSSPFVSYDDLKWKCDFSNFNIDGDISEQTIKNRIRVEDGFLVVDDPKENASWMVKLTLTAYPKYYLDEEFDNIPTSSKPTTEVMIQAIKIQDLSISTKSEVFVNNKIEVSVNPYPFYSTKLKGVNYTYSTTTPDILDIKISNQGTTITAKKEGTANLVVTLLAYNNTVTISKSTTITVYGLRPVVFIIDQRYNNGLKEPNGMVSQHYILKSDGSLLRISNDGATGDPSNNTLSWLRKNTHSYVSRCLENGSVRLKQLSDTSRKTFADGSSATSYISNENGEFDVFLKFGSDIYYKTERWTPKNETTPNIAYIAVTIAKEIPSNEDASKWCKWSQYKLVGVYEACQINNKLYSLSGKRPINNITQKNSINQAKARGANFTICDYDMTKLFAFLFYGYYSSLGCQQICGYGTVNDVDKIYYPKITGNTDELNMTDTNRTTGNGDTNPGKVAIMSGSDSKLKSVNFWGLENCWGDISEWISNIRVMQVARDNDDTPFDATKYIMDYLTEHDSVIYTDLGGDDHIYTSKDFRNKKNTIKYFSISDKNSNSIRLVYFNDINTRGYIEKMIFGTHADTLVDMFGNKYYADADTGFTDYFVNGNTGTVAIRSDASNTPNGGVGFLSAECYPNTAYSTVGARLMYDGDENTVHVIDDATEEL